MKVAYIHQENLSSYSLMLMLNEAFGKRNVTAISGKRFSVTDLSPYDMLVLPGTATEENPYFDLFLPQDVTYLRKQVEEGMIIWTDCAATYHVCDYIQYTDSDLNPKSQRGLNWIEATGAGPVSGRALPRSASSKFMDVATQRIIYDGHTAEICYGNGPGLHLSPSETLNPSVKIIARYKDVENNPVAALTKRIGRGLLISTGVLVQIAPDEMKEALPYPEAEAHRRSLFNKLVQVEPQRLHFRDYLINEARQHYRGLRTGRKTASLLDFPPSPLTA